MGSNRKRRGIKIIGKKGKEGTEGNRNKGGNQLKDIFKHRIRSK